MAFNGSGVYTPPSTDFPAVSGTTIQSSKYNNVVNDMATGISTAITKDGQTTPTANLPMGGYKHTGVGNSAARDSYAATGQVQDSAFTWAGTAGGTANAITLSTTPAITAYAAGQSFTYKSGASANTSTMTVNVNSVGAKAIQKNGAALASGDHPAGMWFRITYDGAAFQLEQLAPTSAEVTASLALKANLASPSFTGTVAMATPLAVTSGGTGSGVAATAFSNIKQQGDSTTTGVWRAGTNAEQLAGSLSTVSCTPAGLASTKSYATSGYQKFPGGLIFQWGQSGSVTADSNATINLPLTFPTAGLIAVATIQNSSTTDDDTVARVISLSTTQVVIRAEGLSASHSGTPFINYIAIGY